MSELDVLSSLSVGFFTPPSSQSVFPNYKLEIQDGQGAGVEVIKLESSGFSPNPPTNIILHPCPLTDSTHAPCGLLVGGL